MPHIFVPREIREGETRVAAVPETVQRLIRDGFEVTVERGAGVASMISDEAYERAGATLSDDAGFYAVGDRRYGASLLSDSESAVRAPDINATRASESVPARQEERQVPRRRTEWTALAAVALVLGELAYLRRRGDL